MRTSTQKSKKDPDPELSSRRRDISEEPSGCVKSNINTSKHFHNFLVVLEISQ